MPQPFSVKEPPEVVEIGVSPLLSLGFVNPLGLQAFSTMMSGWPWQSTLIGGSLFWFIGLRSLALGVLVGCLTLLVLVTIEKRNTKAWVERDGVHKTSGLFRKQRILPKEAIRAVRVTKPLGGATFRVGSLAFTGEDHEWVFHGVPRIDDTAQKCRLILGLSER